jgi:hypothetical protein
MPDKAVLDSLNHHVEKLAEARWEILGLQEKLDSNGASHGAENFNSLVDRLSETIYGLYGSIDSMCKESGFPEYERKIPIRDRKYIS